MNHHTMKQLPQHIQDLIGEYNVEHRPQMKPVFYDILYIHCVSCMDKVERKNVENTWDKDVYCSVRCIFDDHYRTSH